MFLRNAYKSKRTRPFLTGFLKDMILAGVLGGRLAQRQATLRGLTAEGHGVSVLAVDIYCSHRARKKSFSGKLTALVIYSLFTRKAEVAGKKRQNGRFFRLLLTF